MNTRDDEIRFDEELPVLELPCHSGQMRQLIN